MSEKAKKSIFFLLPTIAIFGAVIYFVKFVPADNAATDKKDQVQEQQQEQSNEENTQVANPASTYCVEQGGQLEIEQTEEGDTGLCVFSNGVICEEWDFFNRKCFPKAPDYLLNKEGEYSAIIKTNLGDIELELFSDTNPITVNNFVFLANNGFYNNVIFHRIIKDFMVQSGDPEGTGRGGPGYRFDDEMPILKSYNRGILAMANAGPNTNGSQFFIMTKDNETLPKNYVIFGEITKGLEVLDEIASSEVKLSESGELSKPVAPPVINTVSVLENMIPMVSVEEIVN